MTYVRAKEAGTHALTQETTPAARRVVTPVLRDLLNRVIDAVGVGFVSADGLESGGDSGSAPSSGCSGRRASVDGLKGGGRSGGTPA